MMFGKKVFGGQLKRERAMVDDEARALLSVKLICGQEIDRATMNLKGYRRKYQAILWVRSGEEYITDVAFGLPNPYWNFECRFPLRINEPNILHVEVYRIGSKLDPGPSNGIVLVGETRIPVPKLYYRNICGSHVILRQNYGYGADAASASGFIEEGQVILSMETQRVLRYY